MLLSSSQSEEGRGPVNQQFPGCGNGILEEEREGAAPSGRRKLRRLHRKEAVELDPEGEQEFASRKGLRGDFQGTENSLKIREWLAYLWDM